MYNSDSSEKLVIGFDSANPGFLTNARWRMVGVEATEEGDKRLQEELLKPYSNGKRITFRRKRRDADEILREQVEIVRNHALNIYQRLFTTNERTKPIYKSEIQAILECLEMAQIYERSYSSVYVDQIPGVEKVNGYFVKKVKKLTGVEPVIEPHLDCKIGVVKAAHWIGDFGRYKDLQKRKFEKTF